METDKNLPNESDAIYLTDGGLETTLIFLEGFKLPYFAAFDLLTYEKGYQALRSYYTKYLKIAKKFKTGFILESATWRANPDWVEKVGYPRSATSKINEDAINLLTNLKAEFEDDLNPILISGCIGPRGDGYIPENCMLAEEAQQYHAEQINALSHTPIDLITAITMNYVEEAIGIARAANALHLPVVISFTLETNGKLPTGMSLKEAIKKVDESAEVPPLYFMINCAHPTHFLKELSDSKNEDWIKRIKGVRANASCKSHAELDEAIELDRGIPQDLAKQYKVLKDSFDHLNVFGGCCGTDEEHILEIANQVKTTSN